MKYQTQLQWMIPVIAALALFAAGLGLFDQTIGAAYSYTNHRSETVLINGQGLYYYNSVSSAAQMQANDLVSLVLGLPLLLISSYFAFRASLRGRLLLTGTLGFYLYTYMSMAMLTSYNKLFLVYVVLFALSLYAFILALFSFDLETLPRQFSENLPRRQLAGLLFFVAFFLVLAWLARIFAEMQPNQIASLENTTSRVIQAMDLVLIAPAAVLAGVLLLRHHALSYLLTSVMVMKMLTMGLAVSLMGINMSLRGVGDSIVILVIFLTITVLNLAAAFVILKDIQPKDRKRDNISSDYRASVN